MKAWKRMTLKCLLALAVCWVGAAQAPAGGPAGGGENARVAPATMFAEGDRKLVEARLGGTASSAAKPPAKRRSPNPHRIERPPMP